MTLSFIVYIFNFLPCTIFDKCCLQNYLYKQFKKIAQISQDFVLASLTLHTVRYIILRNRNSQIATQKSDWPTYLLLNVLHSFNFRSKHQKIKQRRHSCLLYHFLIYLQKMYRTRIVSDTFCRIILRLQVLFKFVSRSNQ